MLSKWPFQVCYFIKQTETKFVTFTEWNDYIFMNYINLKYAVLPVNMNCGFL